MSYVIIFTAGDGTVSVFGSPNGGAFRSYWKACHLAEQLLNDAEDDGPAEVDASVYIISKSEKE